MLSFAASVNLGDFLISLYQETGCFPRTTIKYNNMDVLGKTGVMPNTESRKPRQDVEAFLVEWLLLYILSSASI
jgi:hypothetical protein